MIYKTITISKFCIVPAMVLLNLFTPMQVNAQNLEVDSAGYKVSPVYVPVAKRPAVEYAFERLQIKKICGMLPTYDGEHFQLYFDGSAVKSKDDARELMMQFLESLTIPLKLDDQLRLNINNTNAITNEKYINDQIKAGQEATKKRLSGQFKEISKSSGDMIDEMGNDIRKQAAITVTLYGFDQYYDNTLIDNTSIHIAIRNQNEIASMNGRFFTAVKTTNRKVLTADAAIRRAVAQIKMLHKLGYVAGDAKGAKMVLLPYGEGFKYAWKTEITADGPYDAWIDAETAKVLQLFPKFFFADNARGLVFNPSPTQGTTEMSFEVDPPSGGKYILKKTGVITLINNAADGTTGLVEVNDDGSGSANFNVSPLNGTVVERTSQTNYNGQFQQINAYAHVFNEMRIYNFLGSQPFNAMSVTVNDNDACGYGINNACSGGSYLEFGIGNGTTGNSTICNGVRFNAAIDATIIAHELGHTLNGLQYSFGGGSMTGAINEGLADFWAHTIFDMDISAGWFAHNCTVPTQAGGSPRQADAADIFPDLFSTGGSSGSHSAGQIMAWANWSARQGMNDAIAFGTLSINLSTIKAMTTAGNGGLLDGSEKSIHDSYKDLLEQLLPLYCNSRLVHKLLSGYARAGIFLSPKDAVIDIDHAYLNRNSATGPTFTIWTGEDYTFNANNTVNTGTQPFNTQFMVEVANDEAFTSNLISSGWLGGVTSGTGGTATWTLPASDWNTLKAGDAIYYKVTTKDASGGNIRQSWHPGNNICLTVPYGKAAINETGTRDCSCSASGGNSNSAMALIPLVIIGILIALRRKFRKNDFMKDNEKQNN